MTDEKFQPFKRPLVSGRSEVGKKGMGQGLGYTQRNACRRDLCIRKENLSLESQSAFLCHLMYMVQHLVQPVKKSAF
jgi:hypothetical protein